MSRVISTGKGGSSGPHPNDQLTKAQLGRLPEGEHPFGQGLSLVVRAPQPVTRERDWQRYWAQYIEVAGKPREIRLGTLQKVTKNEAREFARLNRLIASAGGDPGLPVADPLEPAAEKKLLFRQISEWARGGRDRTPTQVTDLVVRQAKPGRRSVGGCLILRVHKSGSRSWFARVTLNGTRRDFGLGSYPAVSLAAARERAEEYRTLARLGKDPRKKDAASPPTLREALPLVIEGLKTTWTGADAEAQYRRTLELHAFPVLGDKRVDEVTVEDCYAVVHPLWDGRRGCRGYRLRHQLVHILDWACNNKYRTDNPAGPALRSRLSRVKSEPEHRPSLPYAETRAALEALQVADVDDVFKLLIPFLVLTAVRLSEASEAEWSEIKWDRALWVIPAHRMKKKDRSHRVPLSRQALAVLEAVRKACPPGNKLIFGFRQGRRRARPVTSAAVSRVLQKELQLTDDEDRPVVAHGFRTTFTDWVSENTNVSEEVSEAALAHAPPSATRRAYQRKDFLTKRAPLMQQWADYIMPLESPDLT